MTFAHVVHIGIVHGQRSAGLDAEHDGGCEHADGDERGVNRLTGEFHGDGCGGCGDAVGDHHAAGERAQRFSADEPAVGGDPGSVRELGEHRQQHPGDDGDSKRHGRNLGWHADPDGVEWSSGLQWGDLGGHGGTELRTAVHFESDADAGGFAERDHHLGHSDDHRVERG